jgi:hypothetical protein
MLYFASRYAGRVFWPIMAGIARLLSRRSSAGSRLPASASAIPACSRFVAAAALNIGAINAVAMWLGTFGRQPA